ncbi:hypothetical protein SAMN05444410_1277 [Hydrobacter penzbergensis]|uniref:Uncharacterized protein n=1 Tax=Hydrobacter penzbergensis TaxID=1235997 RepID=A0A8X8IG92_9BACT|nr:hypothetical protein SAMN05444410_1277 [Hydrobacter penzbergensis]
MKNLIFKVLGYILFRFLVFFIVIHLIDKNVKWVEPSDLRNKEDWFMFLWLFLVPILIEMILLTLPFAYGLNKIINAGNKRVIIWGLFILLFLCEFAIYKWVIPIEYLVWKVIISIFLFLFLFRKRLLNPKIVI